MLAPTTNPVAMCSPEPERSLRARGHHANANTNTNANFASCVSTPTQAHAGPRQRKRAAIQSNVFATPLRPHPVSPPSCLPFSSIARPIAYPGPGHPAAVGRRAARGACVGRCGGRPLARSNPPPFQPAASSHPPTQLLLRPLPTRPLFLALLTHHTTRLGLLGGARTSCPACPNR